MKKTRIRFEQHKLTLITGLLILASCISGGVQLSSCTTFSQNIFYTAEPSRFDLTKSTDNTFCGNRYLGNYTALPDDPEAKTACQQYEEQILSAGSDGRHGLEKLMKQRDVCGTSFLFIDKDRIETFFGQLQ